MTVIWSSYSYGKTLLPILNEALATIYGNVICIYDLRTGEMRYVQADSPEDGRCIECFTTHSNMPLLAFAESIIRPSVFVLQYPSMSKYTIFTSSDIVRIEDLKFNQSDLLFALSGYPFYTMLVWNFRTGQQVLQHDTMLYSIWGSLKLSNHQMSQVAQYSHWYKEIVVWEMSYADDTVDVHEVSRVKLKKEDGANVSPFAVCYTNDNHLFYMDIYGILYSVEMTLFDLKKQWSLFGDSSLQDKEPESYAIFPYKQGLLVMGTKTCHYICPKAKIWTTEWKVILHSLDICALAINSNNDIFGANSIGNLYQISVTEDMKTNVKSIYNMNALGDDFLVLNGVKEECVIHLLRSCHLKVIELGNGRILSMRKVDNASAMAQHDVLPWVVVGTTTSMLHLINYENPKEPVELSRLQSDTEIPVLTVDLLDQTLIYNDNYLTFYLINLDLSNGSMTRIGPVINFGDPITLVQYFLGENNRSIMLFVEREPVTKELPIPVAKEFWCYEWKSAKGLTTHYALKLPNVYRDVTRSSLHPKNMEEYYAVRIFSNIIDYLRYNTETHELQFLQSFRTQHNCHINGIAMTRNITTWGVDACYTHMRFHKKVPGQMYAISQCLHVRFRALMIDKALECFNFKYLLSLWGGRLKVYRINRTQYPLQENVDLPIESVEIKPHEIKIQHWDLYKEDVVIEYSPAELQARANLLRRIEELSKETSALIDYDIAVTGKTKGVFRKFCMNTDWLEELTIEAQSLCELERKVITECIEERCRIRDWLRALILQYSTNISYNVRTIFSNFSAENYGIPKDEKVSREYDQFRFYDMDPPDDNADDEETESIKKGKAGDKEEDEGGEDEEKQLVPVKIKRRKYLYVEGPSVFDHVMSDDLALQDVDVVTAHQMHNQQQKYKLHLVYALRREFNKKFEEVYQLKGNLMDSISKTNENLRNIFKNMNCMLCLLNMEKYIPAELTVAQWEKNEVITRIMDVDDSEIKAINRRKKKVEEAEKKKGRMLLWSVDFWVKALVVMMDGVLEKLWEEEIKKEIPLPEFMLKKEVAEYTLEDQKMLRDYEEKVRRLAEDRHKYLRILGDNEKKALDQKLQYIKRINEQVTSLMIVKLKYDHAIKHVQLRNLSTKMTYSKRLMAKQDMRNIRNNLDQYDDCITQYNSLCDYWEKNLQTLRSKLEMVESRDKAQERYFKNQYLNLLPAQVVKEVVRAYRKRIKIAPKIYSSQLMCKTLAQRVAQKTVSRLPFPVPMEVDEYLDSLKAMDDVSNMPQNLEQRLWEQMVKLRRQKIETELKLRSLHIQVSNAQSIYNNYSIQLRILSEIKDETVHRLEEMKEDYFVMVQDQPLTIRLYYGQVETNLLDSFRGLENCILMHKEDITDVNDLILRAGEYKLKMMQKVAKFRRQVIFTEWEHKTMRATISHLKFMLNVLRKCKVSLEFLDIIRNWKKVKSQREHMVNSVGLIEKIRENKINNFRENLTRLNTTLDKFKQQVNRMKHSNQKLNCEIDDVKVNVALANNQRDILIEKKRAIEQQEKMDKINKHAALINIVRKDHAKIMELRMILQLTRMRTIPMLGPNPDQCEK